MYRMITNSVFYIVLITQLYGGKKTTTYNKYLSHHGEKVPSRCLNKRAWDTGFSEKVNV